MAERQPRVLLAEDEGIVREVLGRLLADAGYPVVTAETGEDALRRARQEPVDVVLLDLMLPDRDGLEVLQRLKEGDPGLPVILITAFGTIETAVQAMRLGAFDFITKPFKNEEVLVVVRNAARQRYLEAENRQLRDALRDRDRFHRIVGKSKPMQEIYRLIEQVSSSRTTVLIQGESGTGKELIAQAIHLSGNRADQPFVVVHSGSMPPDLLESNLFGHVRGAFTGAVASKKGLFEVAGNGSIFFDEISTVQTEVQAKLLRVIQEKEFLPLGAVDTVTVDVRILAATNVDLLEMVKRGEFREDLYYRLNVISIHLPPLRDRVEDIPLLVGHFLEKYAAENSRPPLQFTGRALQSLIACPWPGNIRELENVVERAVVLATGDRIDLDLLPAPVRVGAGRPPGGERELESLGLNAALDRYEAELILRTLRETDGVQRRAARKLGIKPSTLNEKIKRLGIRP
ncbi:MAG: sigma-54-dependent Fis family transcriptional regulator [Acidobacteria bacterium]|nr:sigma-54-dependent Fis family transcriptional regulator [Acidobacteriota bacterium]